MLLKELVYIAGPLSSGDRSKVEANVKAAADVGTIVWQAGYVPFVPHLAWGQFYYDLIPYDQALDACRDMVHRCQAMILLPDWRSSRGAVFESGIAEDLEIPTTDRWMHYRDPESLKRWLTSVQRGDYPFWDVSRLDPYGYGDDWS